MGDRCYMEVTCRKRDQAIFEDLGFELSEGFDPTGMPNCVFMVDPEANYGHNSALPTNIPYLATAGSGSEYDAQRIACDGTTLLDLNVSDHDSDCVLIRFDKNGDPDPKDLKAVKEFYEHESRVEQMLKDALPFFEVAVQYNTAKSQGFIAIIKLEAVDADTAINTAIEQVIADKRRKVVGSVHGSIHTVKTKETQYA